MEILLTILAFLYACTGILVIIGYLPTLRDLTKKISSANIHSYLIWTFSGLIVFLYVFLIISDLLMEIIIGLDLAFCVIILIMSLRLKYTKPKHLN